MSIDALDGWTGQNTCEVDEAVDKLLLRFTQEPKVSGMALEVEEGWAIIELETQGASDLTQIVEWGYVLQEELGLPVLWRASSPFSVSYVVGAKIEKGIGFDEAIEYELAFWDEECLGLEDLRAHIKK